MAIKAPKDIGGAVWVTVVEDWGRGLGAVVKSVKEFIGGEDADGEGGKVLS